MFLMLSKLSRRIIFILILLFLCGWGKGQSQLDTARLLIQLEQAPDDNKAAILNQLSAANSENDSEKAIQYAERALELSKKYGDQRNEALAFQNLCLGYLYHDIYHKALENGLAALELWENIGQTEDIAYMLSTLGWLYYDIQNAKLALHYHQKVLDIYLRTGQKEKVSFGYNSLGLAYSLKEEYETALFNYLQSLKIAEEIQSVSRQLTAHSNLGMTYTSLKSYDLALKHLHQALALTTESTSQLTLAEIYNQLGKAYLGAGQYSQAKKNLEVARSIVENFTSKASKEKLMDNLEYSSDLFAKTKAYQQAYLAFKEYARLRNEILSEEKSNKLLEMRLLYETEKKENEIRLLENQKKIDRLFRNAFFIGLLLLGIIAYLSISKLKTRHQKSRLAQENLRDKLEFKNSELTTFALHISQRNKILNQFIDSLIQIKQNAKPPISQQLKKLINQIEQSKTINQDLEEFHLNVENEYRDFFYKLEKRFPDLTENDKRLSSQLRLNLSNKDIANLNNVAIKSVEMARYRLRKKLNLSPKDNIVDFLKQL